MTLVQFLICAVACSGVAMAFRAHCRVDGLDYERAEVRRRWDAVREDQAALQGQVEALRAELHRRDRHTNDRVDILWNEVGVEVRAGQGDPKPWGGDGASISLGN